MKRNSVALKQFKEEIYFFNKYNFIASDQLQRNRDASFTNQTIYLVRS